MTRVAIITGASSGMGAEFCKRLDAYNLDSIWLIARRKDKLDEVASSLKTANRIITADLTDPSQIASIKALIDSEVPDIRYLRRFRKVRDDVGAFSGIDEIHDRFECHCPRADD